MKIRPATSADAEQITAFWNPMIRDSAVTFSSVLHAPQDVVDLIHSRQTSGYAFVVAEEGTDIIGFATYSQFRGGNGYRHSMEHTIILSDAARGKGVGRKLMAEIEDHARNADAHSMIAGVSGDNPAGVNFHAAVGYKLVAVVPQVGRKFDRWMDLHLMQKLL